MQSLVQQIIAQPNYQRSFSGSAGCNVSNADNRDACSTRAEDADSKQKISPAHHQSVDPSYRAEQGSQYPDSGALVLSGNDLSIRVMIQAGIPVKPKLQKT